MKINFEKFKEKYKSRVIKGEFCVFGALIKHSPILKKKVANHLASELAFPGRIMITTAFENLFHVRYSKIYPLIAEIMSANDCYKDKKEAFNKLETFLNRLGALKKC